MHYLLDTVVVSAARRLTRQEPAFQDFMQNLTLADAFLSAVTIMEIRSGIQRQQKPDPAFAALLSEWLDDEVLSAFAGRVLAFDVETALQAGALRNPGYDPKPDVMIAATALQHGLQMVTRNVADFEALGVACIDPWRHDPIGY